MKTIIFIVIMAITSLSYSQSQVEENTFKGHQNLIGGIWKSASDAAWGDGTPFKQHIVYKESLNGQIIKTQTKGNISQQGKEFGLRNESIIFYDKEKNKLKFYVFDVFGSLTSGKIGYQDHDIYYSYKYSGSTSDLILTDCWKFIDKNTYNFTVGVYDETNNKWEKKFLETQFKRSKKE